MGLYKRDRLFIHRKREEALLSVYKSKLKTTVLYSLCLAENAYTRLLMECIPGQDSERLATWLMLGVHRQALKEQKCLLPGIPPVTDK